MKKHLKLLVYSVLVALIFASSQALQSMEHTVIAIGNESGMLLSYKHEVTRGGFLNSH